MRGSECYGEWLLKNSANRGVFSAAMVASAEFLPLASAKRRLPQWELSVG